MTAQGGAPAHRATAGLVLLHGRGAAAHGMINFAEGLALPEVAMIAPEAPDRSWWPTSFMAPMEALDPWLEPALEAVDKAVTALTSAGLPRASISVCGFSQGACLALEYAARSGLGLSAVFAFTGGLLGTADADDAATPALHGFTPKRFDYDGRLDGLHVDMSCHDRDPHIPLARFHESEKVLRHLGARVTARIAPGAIHSITEGDVVALRSHLNMPPETSTAQRR